MANTGLNNCSSENVFFETTAVLVFPFPNIDRSTGRTRGRFLTYLEAVDLEYYWTVSELSGYPYDNELDAENSASSRQTSPKQADISLNNNQFVEK